MTNAKLIAAAKAELESVHITDIRGAVARGWTAPRNSAKEFDPDLALAASDEIATLFGPLRSRVPQLIAALEAAEAEVARLREALRSIADNSCCGACREAALVARAALQEKPHE